MLPLAPSSTSQVAIAPQSMLHDSPHVPAQSAPSPQSRLQLLPQVSTVKSQLWSAAHEQVAPVQSGGGADPPPQATRTHTHAASTSFIPVGGCMERADGRGDPRCARVDP